MSKIKSAFENGKAFVPFITCGDPDLETTKKIVRASVENGADLIELGIPFSDPTAEGPVIQGANIRALAGGVTTDKIFEMVRNLRKDISTPMVFMTYANVVFSYNAEKFIFETVESVIKQTYKNLQIIIVDDCSTDNTYELVKSINDDRIEVYRPPFNGLFSFANNESF